MKRGLVNSTKGSLVGAPDSRHHPLRVTSLSGRGVRVAVIDSGVDPTHPRVRIEGGVDLAVGRDGAIVAGMDYGDVSGHGTACAGIIGSKAPDATLFSVRIFDESLAADGRALAAALEWSIEHRMDVANLSLGTTDVTFRDELAAVCARASEAGLILVAAEHNAGLPSYPAVFPEVIGVAAGVVAGRFGYYYRPGLASECVARGDEQRLCWLEPRQVMTGGTSFAAPHIAGIATLIKEKLPEAKVDEVREVLRENAIDGEPVLVGGVPAAIRKAASVPPPGGGTQARAFAWIGKAALYPYNKEMHGFVRYRDHLHFDLVGIADPAGRGLAGKDAGVAIGLPPAGIRISPRIEDAVKGADSLILGYVDELGRIGKRDMLREAITQALEAGLSVFSLLPVPDDTYGDLHERARRARLRIEFPDVTPDEVKTLLQETSRYDAVDVPVLAVVGTSSQQGKFTVQLALRRRLLDIGYSISQVGTEHQSELFGMDFAFPMGYASPLQLPLQFYAPFLDAKMRQIAHDKTPDIMLAGSQSGTIPYDVEEHSTHSLPSLAFLLGIKPDACILVVNSIDPDDYISDTMDAIRALVKAPTILLAMPDKEKHLRAAYGRSWVTPRQLTDDEIDRHLRRLEERFGLPAASIVSRDGEDLMVATVIDHFSQKKGQSCRTEPG